VTLSDAQVRALLVRYQPPPAATSGDWNDVVNRAASLTDGRRPVAHGPRSRHRRVIDRRLGVAVCVAIVVALAFGVQQGLAQRAASYFSGEAPPSESTQALKVAEERFHTLVRTAPQLDLASPKEIAQFPTRDGVVHWYAAVDVNYRGVCELAVRKGHDLGGTCQSTPHRWVWTIGSGASIDPALVVSGILPAHTVRAEVLLANGRTVPAETHGRVFALVLENRSIEEQIAGLRFVQAGGRVLITSRLGRLGQLMRSDSPLKPGIFASPTLAWLSGASGASSGF